VTDMVRSSFYDPVSEAVVEDATRSGIGVRQR